MRRLLGVLLAVWLLTGNVPSARAADPITQAVAWLHTQQCSDGSFGFRRSDGGCVPSASVTADVVYVLALAGEDPAGPAWTVGGQSALDALSKLAPSYVYEDAGQAGKVARAVALAGGNPRSFGGLNLVGIIQAAYDPTTGRYHPALLYRHTLAIEGLLRSGEAVPKAAVNALIQAQLPDGSWFWSFDGAQGDVDTTGRVMQLLGDEVALNEPEAFARAARFLFAKEESGGWGVSYLAGSPNANSTALAVAGLRAAGHDPQSFCFQRSGLGGADILLTYQEPSGAFVYIRQSGREESRLMATADALNALLQPLASSSAAPVCRLTYLPLVLR
jgi:hypothetical protein